MSFYMRVFPGFRRPLCICQVHVLLRRWWAQIEEKEKGEGKIIQNLFGMYRVHV